MPIERPQLPYAPEALEPHISRRTIEFHYGRHHQGYVDTLNRLITGTEFESQSLDEILLATHKSHPKIFNNAAQTWNHDFYWNCLRPHPPGPSSYLEHRMAKDFGSLANFKAQFSTACKDLFGSGWVWLVKTPEGKLEIRALEGAENPLIASEVPLLTCDVWEHAYYLDYQNERARYVENFWKLIDWSFVEGNLEGGLGRPTWRKQIPDQDTSIHSAEDSRPQP